MVLEPLGNLAVTGGGAVEKQGSRESILLPRQRRIGLPVPLDKRVEPVCHLIARLVREKGPGKVRQAPDAEVLLAQSQQGSADAAAPRQHQVAEGGHDFRKGRIHSDRLDRKRNVRTPNVNFFKKQKNFFLSMPFQQDFLHVPFCFS